MVMEPGNSISAYWIKLAPIQKDQEASDGMLQRLLLIELVFPPLHWGKNTLARQQSATWHAKIPASNGTDGRA